MKNGEEHGITIGGINVYSYRNPSSHGFHLSLFVRAGSMYEQDGESGISHFFEHIAIRNVNKIMNGELYSMLDERGIEFNASTYSEMIQFYVGGASSNFRHGADVLIKIFSPIVLTSDEVFAERMRIKAEIRESDELTSLSAFTSQRVHEGTALSHSIIGTVGSVNKIGKRALDEFRTKTLTAENVFFYITGNVTDEDIEYLKTVIEGVRIPIGKKRLNIAPVSRNFRKRPQEIHIKNADFTMLRLTFDLDMSKISMAEADLIYDILLSGYNSEFFIELSEKRGLFYDASGSLERYLNIGTLSFSFEVRGSTLYESVAGVSEILNRMKNQLLPEQRCMRAAYVDNAYMLLDDPREMNFTFAYDNHIMDAHYSDIDERVSAYSAVTPERIRELARDIFCTENLTFTMKGKAKRTDRERLLDILSSLDA